MAADTSYVGGKLPFTTFEFVNGDRSIQFHTGDSIRWSCDIVSYSCPPADSVSRPERSEVHSPDRSRVAFERDENLWIRRTAILHQLTYRNETDVERLFGYVLATAGETDFFIRKADGWALREYAKSAPGAVRRFVAEHETSLSALTRREALKNL